VNMDAMGDLAKVGVLLTSGPNTMTVAFIMLFRIKGVPGIVHGLVVMICGLFRSSCSCPRHSQSPEHAIPCLDEVLWMLWSADWSRVSAL
jgi:uncharacterized membrane protein YqaE (UPF0057 family)